MQRFILGRVVQSIVSMFVVSVVVFALVRMSGDPIQIMMPAEATRADIDLMRAHLPGITVGWFAVAGLMRLTRSSMLDVLGSEYVKLARIKGLPERRVIWLHAFKNAALPVVTFAALLFVALLNGSIIVETVFGWPGLGLLVIEAVDSRDYPIVQAVGMCLSAMYIGVNLLGDVLYA